MCTPVAEYGEMWGEGWGGGERGGGRDIRAGNACRTAHR